MRILYLHQYFTTPDYAGGTRSYEFARRLERMGHEVTVLTSSAYLDLDWTPGPGWFVHDIEGVRVEVIRSSYSNRMAYSGRLVEFISFAFQATLRGRTIPADVIFASSTPLTIAIPGALLAARKGVPFVFEVRDLWPEVPIAIGALKNPVLRWTARKLEAWAYRRAAHVVALSPDMRDGVLGGGVDAGKVTVVPNAADIDLFADREGEADAFRRSHDWLGDRPMVLYAGTLGVINDVETFVKMAAAATAVDDRIRFVVIGDGVMRESIEIRARKVGVLDRTFHMLPPMPKHDVAAAIAAADLSISLVVPNETLWANSANKVFDAMAAGTTVAVNHGGWIAEVLLATGAGHVLPHGDSAEAGRAIARIVTDAEGLERSAQAARTLAAEQFDRDRLAGELERVLAGVILEPDPRLRA